MQYGMYLAASSVSANMARQDVIANNLANVSTVGFKPDALDLRFRQSARAEDHVPQLPSNLLLERLGGGVLPMATRVDASQGPLQATSNPLDVAIEGDGFFVTRSGPGGDEAVRLTRDGRLTIRADGTLVTASGGYPLLSSSGSPVTVNPKLGQPIEIRPDGSVVQGGTEVGRFQVASVADASRLQKDGDNLLRTGGQEITESQAQIRQGHVELSGVDAIRAMMGVTNASNAAQSGLGMISYYSDMMSRAIQALGRVS